MAKKLAPHPTREKNAFSAHAEGVLAPRLCTLEGSTHPPSTRAESFGAHVCKVTFKHLPQLLRSNIQSFGTLGQRGSPPPLSKGSELLSGIIIFLYMHNNPMKTPPAQREEEETNA